jgi:hypothetical protein
MATPERRITPRFRLQTPLVFHRMEALFEGAHKADAINISTGGVYFLTGLSMHVGEALEVMLAVPRRVTGTKATMRRFIARVSHVEVKSLSAGQAGVGVQLIYYEHDLIVAPLQE